MVSRAV